MIEKDSSEQDGKLLMRLAEVAKMLSLSPRTVWALANTGELKSFKVGNARLFSLEAIQEWISTKIKESSND